MPHAQARGQTFLEAYGVLFGQAQIFQHGHNPPKGFARALLDHGQGGIQQACIAPELVENKAPYTPPFSAGEQGHGASQGRKGPATVNIRHQGHMRPGITGHAHVYNVVGLEVNFGRAARPFKHHHVHICGQTAVGAAHGLPGFRLIGEILAHAHVPHGFAQHNNLRTHVGRGLEQHGVHAHVWREAAGGGLQDLSAAHFLAVAGYKRIERHVLRLERCNPQPPAGQQAAYGRRNQAFARV